MDFTTLTIEALKALASVVGSYGLAIILLTVVIRLAMWPLNVSQQRSMKMMQSLQPKIKAIQDRYKNDPFIIHDVRRSKALVAYQCRWYISDFDGSDIPGISDDEEKIRALWRDYFKNIAIKERTNPRCQKNFMPERYWKHLTELAGI